jgi:hypothetical protein
MSNGEWGDNHQGIPAPLVPEDCDLRDYKMMLDGPRLFASQFDAIATDSEWRAGVTLWAKSFQQVPAASLPNDDHQLARLASIDIKKWRRVKEVALRGWQLCTSDRRLYHPVVAEMALEAWVGRLKQRKSSASGVAKRAEVEFDAAPHDRSIVQALRQLWRINPHAKTLLKNAFIPENQEKEATSRQTIGSTDGQTTGSTDGAPPVQPPLNQGKVSEGKVSSSSVEAKASTGATGAGKVLEFSAGKDPGDKPDWWPTRDRYGRVQADITEKVMFDVGKAVLGKSAGGQVTKLRKLYRGDMRAVTDFLLQADEKSDPPEWFAGVLKRAERDQFDTPKHEIYPVETHP